MQTAINAVYCVKCRRAIAPADVFCKNCGTEQRPLSQQSQPDPLPLIMNVAVVPDLVLPENIPYHLVAILTMWGIYICGGLIDYFAAPMATLGLAMGRVFEIIGCTIMGIAFVVGVYLARQPGMTGQNKRRHQDYA